MNGVVKDWVDHDVALKRVYGAWCGYCEVFPEEPAVIMLGSLGGRG